MEQAKIFTGILERHNPFKKLEKISIKFKELKNKK